MRKSFLRYLVSFLITISFSIGGFLVGTQINLGISELNLYERQSWFNLGESPEDGIASVAASAGFGFIMGKSGTIYSTCDWIYENEDCWIEVESYPSSFSGSCTKYDPPGELLYINTQCGLKEVPDITGLALQKDGEVWAFYADLDSWDQDLWFRIGQSPEDSIVTIASDSGLGYLLGKSGTIYSTCDLMNEIEDCWVEVDTFPTEHDDHCVKRDPPEDTLLMSVECGFGEVSDITGIAVSDDGDVWGYYGQAASIVESVNRWFLLSILGGAIGLYIGYRISGVIVRRYVVLDE